MSKASLVQRILITAGLAAVICAYTYVEIINFTPAYRELDCEGYLLLAKRMSHGGPLAAKEDDIFQCQNHVWIENEKGEVTPKFAPGYPAVMAIFHKIGGDVAMFWVSPVSGVMTLLGAFLLFRLWMTSLTAILATACLAANKMFLVYTGYLLTHSLDICVVTWGMYFLFKWRRHGGLGDAIGAGLILGFACAVRFTEALLAIVIMIAIISRLIPYSRELVAHRRQTAEGSKADAKAPGYHPLVSTAVLVVSYAFFPSLAVDLQQDALWKFFDHRVLFFKRAACLLTCPDAQDSSRDLGWHEPRRTFPDIGGRTGGPMLVIGSWSEGLMLIFWALPLILLHASYYWAGGSMSYLRFFICLFPAFIGSAFALIDKVPLSASRRWFAAVVFAAMVIGFRYDQAKVGIERTVSSPGSRAIAGCGGMLSSSLNHDAVIFSDWNCGTYLGTLRQFRYYNLDVFTVKYGAKAGWGIHVRQQQKRIDRLTEFYRTHNDKELSAMKKKKIEDFMLEGRQIAFLIRPDRKVRELKELGPEYELVPVPGFDAGSVPWQELSQLRLFELKMKKTPDSGEQVTPAP